MLGEKIAEFTGKTVSTRVLPSEGMGHNSRPRMEVSLQHTGKMLGVDCSDTATYTAVMENGFLRGNAQGIMMTKDGESCTWTATGSGRLTGHGSAASWRGAVFYNTTSQKWSKLNGQCGVFELEIDENGLTTSKVAEWK